MTPEALFGGAGPRWFSVAAHRPFMEDLAWGLMQALQPLGPEALADALVLTPTRRAGRALHAAFLKHAGEGGALLPPQIRTLGDLDEGEPPFETAALALDLPPAIGTRRRTFELARLALEHQDLIGRRLDAAGALEMGAALGRLFESAAIEEVGDRLHDLRGLADGDYAAHWRRSADFLEAAAEGWRRRLAALGVVDVAERQVRLLRLLAEQWRREPPAGVVIAAGSTGAAPAIADLLSVIAGLPQGGVVLPGLDDVLADEAWAAVEEQHPQSGMKTLLDRVDVGRAEVMAWPSPETPADARLGARRRRVVNEALRPAEATADWRRVIDRLVGGEDPDPGLEQGLAGLTVVGARHEGEVAAVAALLLRETLETPGATAALVTPDPVLARRVQAALGCWGVTADSSAGVPLTLSAVATLALLLARAAASEAPDVVGLLALLKNRLVRLGRDPADLSRGAATLERRALRGAAPRRWDTLHARLQEAVERTDRTKPDAAGRLERLADAEVLLSQLGAIVADLRSVFASETATAAEAARALAAAMETLARNEAGSLGGLWADPSGEAAASIVAALLEESEALPPVTAAGFAELLEALFAAEIVRTGDATHGRVRILGTIEARLVRADRLILAGLEEGVWPAAAPVDPFLSRPMRSTLGLPPPERRTGQAAHDFAQAACAPEVYLLHADRRGGAPAVKSRWLWRLETLARGAGVALPGRPELLAWARALDRPEGPPRSAPRPGPAPPVAVRPRRLAVTRVEGWVRDPYAVYARYILGLTTLPRPSEAVEAAARGSAIHKALEGFVLAYPDQLPHDCADQLLDRLTTELTEASMDEAAMVRETLLARECAAWLADFESRRRADGVRVLVERQGELTFPTASGKDFTVFAKADRIEVGPETAHVLDFKTGAAPTRKTIDAGFSPQLTLTAAIVDGGGFKDVAVPPGELGYIRVTGRRPAGEECIRVEAAEARDAGAAALEGLRELVAEFDRPETPYRSWAAPQFMGGYGGDYDRLARVWEWHVVGAEAEGET